MDSRNLYVKNFVSVLSADAEELPTTHYLQDSNGNCRHTWEWAVFQLMELWINTFTW